LPNIARKIKSEKKYYNLAIYNCQSFVKDLAYAITPEGFWKDVGNFVSRIPGIGAFFWRDGEEAAPVDKPALEAEILAELDILYGLKERWLTGPGVTAYPTEIGPDEPEPPQIDASFKLEKQPYVPGGDAGELSEFGVVYDSVDHPVFEVAGVLVPESPDQLTESDHAKLKIAEELVGTKSN
jgi:hypothetical protein